MAITISADSSFPALELGFTYTMDPAVVYDYATNLQLLYNLWQGTGFNGVNSATTIFNAVSALRNLVLNGKVVQLRDEHGEPILDADGNSVMHTSRVDFTMASTVDFLLKSLQANGYDYTSNVNLLGNANAFARTQAFSELNDVFSKELERTATLYQTLGEIQTTTLQPFLETEYINRCNDLMFDAMSQIKTALNAAQDALQALTAIQNAYNTVQPEARNANDPNRGDKEFMDWFLYSRYYQEGQSSGNDYTDQQFCRDFPEFVNEYFSYIGLQGVTGFNYQETWENLTEQKANLTTVIGSLAAIRTANPNADGTIPAMDAGGLEASLTKVRDAIPTFDANADYLTNANKIIEWIKDGMGTANTGLARGKRGGDITTAISAASSFNDEQKADLRDKMFVMEEYYKSAADLLAKITQIIEKMAQNIAR